MFAVGPPPEVRAVLGYMDAERGRQARALRAAGLTRRAVVGWRGGTYLPRWREFRLLLEALGWRKCDACQGIGWREPEEEARDG